jgi:LmbE family N-acetylglucosaminyl deacetylase
MGDNVLVIAPHMDDETLGMGGTIARHVLAGDAVRVCVVAHRIYDGRFDAVVNEREKGHARNAANALGCASIDFLDLHDERLDTALQDIIKPLERVVARIAPDVVYSNFYGDNHQDHRAVFQAVRVAIRPSASTRVREWRLYETPSSTDQSPPIPESAFLPNHYVDISNTIVNKIEAFKCYETEMRQSPHPRSLASIEALAVKRGSEVGFLKAEAFMTMRSLWK